MKTQEPNREYEIKELCPNMHCKIFMREDSRQEAYLHYKEKAPRYVKNNLSSARSFFCKTCRHISSDYLEKSNNFVLLDKSYSDSRELSSETDDTYNKGFEERIEELSENQKKILRLKFLNGFIYEEIAGFIGCSIRSVKRSFKEAFDMIKKDF